MFCITISFQVQAATTSSSMTCPLITITNNNSNSATPSIGRPAGLRCPSRSPEAAWLLGLLLPTSCRFS